MIEGIGNPQLIQSIHDLTQVSKTRATLIATDQIQKLNSNLEQIRQQNNGISRYIWRTRRNARVREDHSRLEGCVFKWDQPPVTVRSGKRSGERNHAGEDINCKCWAEPVVDDILERRTKKIIAAESKTRLLGETL